MELDKYRTKGKHTHRLTWDKFWILVIKQCMSVLFELFPRRSMKFIDWMKLFSQRKNKKFNYKEFSVKHSRLITPFIFLSKNHIKNKDKNWE